jgi:hypothetical protein
MATVDVDILLSELGAPAVDPDDAVIDLDELTPATLHEAADVSADVVLAASAFRSLPTAKAQLGLLVEIARVLRVGGWAALALSTDPIGDERQSRRGIFRALAGAEPQRAAGFVPLDALGATAVRAGLRVERIEGANTRDTFVLAFKDAN